MFSPKRTKFRKQHKGRIHGDAKGGTDVEFGDFGLKATAPARVTARQIEAARRAMTRRVRRVGKIWIRVFPDIPVSSKPTEVRMGKGKGSPEFWVAKVKPGRIMFEMDGVPEKLAREAFELAAAKLPIPVKFVTRPAYLAKFATYTLVAGKGPIGDEAPGGLDAFENTDAGVAADDTKPVEEAIN